MTGGTAFDRAVRALADPPAWLRAVVDAEAVLGVLGADRAASPDGGPGRLLAGVAGEVLACEPLDVRLTRDGWRGWYALTVRDGGVTRRVEVSGPLHPPTGPEPARPEPGSPPIGCLRPVAGGADLPALAVLTDPRAAGALLERLVGGGPWPGYRVTGCVPRVVRHARGTRVTVVLRTEHPDGADPRWPRVVVAKGYRGDEGAATHAAMSAMWASPLAASDAVAIARPLGYDPALRVLLQGAVPDDRTLTALVVEAVGDGSRGALDRLAAALRRTADGLVALHASGVPGGPARTPDALAARVRRAADRLGDVLPGARGTADALVAPLLERAAAHPADAAVPSHGGFRPAQVLLDDDDRPGFVDLDGFCRAEPAFDLGRFRARLREIVLATPGGPDAPLSAGRLALADRLADVVLDRYAAAATVSVGRVALWERLELVTALVQTWTRAQLARTPPLAVLLLEAGSVHRG